MDNSQMAKVFKALSSEQRLNLFKMIYYWNKTIPETSCCGVERAFSRACNCMNLSRSTISHHLKELQQAGLLSCTKNGQVLACKINEDVIDSIKSFFD